MTPKEQTALCDECGKIYSIDPEETMRPGICDECFDEEIDRMFGDYNPQSKTSEGE